MDGEPAPPVPAESLPLPLPLRLLPLPPPLPLMLQPAPAVPLPLLRPPLSLSVNSSIPNPDFLPRPPDVPRPRFPDESEAVSGSVSVSASALPPALLLFAPPLLLESLLAAGLLLSLVPRPRPCRRGFLLLLLRSLLLSLSLSLSLSLWFLLSLTLFRCFPRFLIRRLPLSPLCPLSSP
jgi:hypothetical protein